MFYSVLLQLYNFKGIEVQCLFNAVQFCLIRIDTFLLNFLLQETRLRTLKLSNVTVRWLTSIKCLINMCGYIFSSMFINLFHQPPSTCTIVRLMTIFQFLLCCFLQCHIKMLFGHAICLKLRIG